MTQIVKHITSTPSLSKEDGAFQAAAAEFSGKILIQQCLSGQSPRLPLYIH